MNLLLLVAGFAVIFLAGYGAVRWMLCDVEDVYWIEIVGYAWLLGSGMVSILLALGGLVARGPVLVTLVTIAGVGLGICGWRFAASAPRARSFPAETKLWEIALSLLPLVPIGWFAVQTFRETLHWDGLFVWELKARLAFLNDGAMPQSYFSDPRHLWSHSSYPLYLPMLELWTYLWLGEANQFWVKALFPFFPLAAACVLWSAGVRLGGRVWIGAVAVLLLFAVPRAVGARAGVLQGYADLPLAILYLAALSAVLVGSRGWLRVAAVASGLLPWVKQEGLVLWFCFALTAAWLHRRQWRTALVLALPGLITLLTWRAFLAAAEAVPATTFQPLTFETLQANLPRVGPLLQRFGEEMLHVQRWSLLWPLVGVALVALACQRRQATIPLALAIVAPLACDLIPYVFTAIEPYDMHVETSLDRLILQLVPLAVLPLVLVLGRAQRAESSLAAA